MQKQLEISCPAAFLVEKIFNAFLSFFAFQFLAQTVWATVGIIFVLALLASISEIEQQLSLFFP